MKRNNRKKKRKNKNRTHLSLERVEDRVLLDAGGLMFTSPVASLQEDFNSGQPGNLEVSGTSAPFTGVDTEFNGNDGDRTYVRTIDADVSSESFVAEITYTSGATIAFFGIGEASPDSSFNNEPVSPSVHLRMHASSLANGLIHINGEPGFSNAGTGVHRLRLTWDADAQTATFDIDEDYTGGEFVVDSTSGAFDASGVGLSATNSRIFFGGAGGALSLIHI